MAAVLWLVRHSLGHQHADRVVLLNAHSAAEAGLCHPITEVLSLTHAHLQYLLSLLKTNPALSRDLDGL